MIGQTISHYKITSKLGEGGMGEVYLAGDTRLDRQVAIKVLPDAVRQDPERLARLRREAQAAASLKHPDIATIHALEEADGLLFIVMEYVEGETLTERIPADGMDLDSFFSTFIPLTDALAHAHENGRIHRDLKPANVMMTPEGIPKILDFGLARIERGEAAMSDLDSQARTAATKPKAVADVPPSLTQERAFLGTPAYMSPEQIEGKKVDARTDLFSFGVLMYEALTGQRPFQGETVESIMGRILTEEPRSITEQNPITPHQLWWIIRKCLQKDREQRTQSARELHRELVTAQQEVASGPVLVDANTVALPPQKPMPFWGQPTAITAVVLALVLGLVAAWLLKPVPEPPLRKFALPVELVRLRESDGPVISPDGTIVFGVLADTTAHLEVISSQGGEPELFLQPDSARGEVGIAMPRALPDGRGLVMGVGYQDGFHELVVQTEAARPVLVRVPSGERIAGMVVSATGHFLYTQGASRYDAHLWAVPVEPGTWKAAGEPFVVAHQAFHPSVSADGTLAYLSAPEAERRQLAWVDRTGAVVDTIGQPQDNITSACALSGWSFRGRIGFGAGPNGYLAI